MPAHFDANSAQAMEAHQRSLEAKRDVRLKERLQPLYNRWVDREAHRHFSLELRKAHEGEWSHLIPFMPATNKAQRKSRPKFAPNLLKQATTRLSYLYSLPPERKLEDPGHQEWAERHVWGFGTNDMNADMLELDEQVRLHGCVLLQPHWVPKENLTLAEIEAMKKSNEKPPMEEGGFEYRVITPEDFEVEENEFDPYRPRAAMIRIGPIFDASFYASAPTHETFVYWDAEIMMVVKMPVAGVEGNDNDDFLGSVKVLKVREHSFGLVPVVVVRNKKQSRGWWQFGFAGKDGLENIKAIGALFRAYNWVARLQRGQPWASGKIKAGSVVLSPESIIEVEPPGQFGIVSNSADLKGIREALESHIRTLIQTWGLPARSLRLEERGPESGISISLQETELEDDRTRRQPVMRCAEADIVTVCAAIWNGVALERDQGAAPEVESPKFEVLEYKRKPKPMTRAEALDQYRFELEMVMSTREEIKRKLYPNTSEEVLLKSIEAAEQERLTLQSVDREETDADTESGSADTST